MTTFEKPEGLLIQKNGKISIRCLVYSQRPYCWLATENILVCQPKKGGGLDPKTVPE